MDPTQPLRGRARARGRARSVAGPRDVAEVQDQLERSRLVEQQTSMYEEHRGGNGNGGNGNGSDNGNGNNGDNGRVSRGSSRGSPDSRSSGRGSAGGNGRDDEGSGGDKRDNFTDYVVSRPAPDFDKRGNSGVRQQAVTNYYRVQKQTNFQMTLYAIKIFPEVDQQRIVRKLIGSQRETIGAYIISGFQLFTTRPVPPDITEYQVVVEETSYTVSLDYKRVVGLNEGLVFQFYNIVVRQIQQLLDYQLLGRHYFDPRQTVAFNQWRLELWPGFANSIRQQEDCLMLNIESCWKVLQTESILQKMTSIRQRNPENYQAICQETLVGMMIITKYNNKAYKLSRIDWNETPDGTFQFKNADITYKNYFNQRYGINVTVGRQPMLVSEPRLRDIRRGQTGDIYLVPEFCYACGLNDDLRANHKLMKDIGSCLHMPPNERIMSMDAFVQRVCRNDEVQRCLTNWGVKVEPQKVAVNARVLDRTELLFGRNETFKPDDKADWTNAFRSKEMKEKEALQKWGLVVTARDQGGVQNLVNTMQRVAGAVGYRISPPNVIRINDQRSSTYVEGVNNAMANLKESAQMVFVVLATNNADTYAAVKKRCSIDYGVPSQCFLAKNLGSKGLMSICTKMIIQMNAKQGGEPWAIKSPSQNMMVLGYDVHHAGPGGGASIGAMTATVYGSLGKCYSTIARMNTREEVATEVAKMFEKCLNAYYENSGVLPERVMMYRDGVGEGQLLAVYEQELEGFKERLKQVYSGKGTALPKLSYIVVNKRISTRFFEVVGRDKFGNPKPGFVVDDTVTRPERYDFFLVSQTARQGCVSPTYYNVLFDESGLQPDKLQSFTYKLCHLYFNWTGTVAVPGPCQNAHKLAFLVGTALKRPASPRLSHLLHFL